MAATNTGIYMIKNMINGKFYIGSSKHLHNRKIQHLRDLRNNKHCNLKLQYAYNKYGKENFEYIIIQYCEKKDLIKKGGKFWQLDIG